MLLYFEGFSIMCNFLKMQKSPRAKLYVLAAVAGSGRYFRVVFPKLTKS